MAAFFVFFLICVSHANAAAPNGCDAAALAADGSEAFFSGTVDNDALATEEDESLLVQVDHRFRQGLMTKDKPIQGNLTLEHFALDAEGCYDRSTRNNWAVVDAHLHSRPFGGPPVPFPEMLNRMRTAGILFATLYGIGQRLPIDSPCTYYLDCPGTKITPSLKNDFFNAQSILDYNETLATDPVGPRLTLSMSFLNLHDPKSILPTMRMLQAEYPKMFKWVGEINVAKQALWNNSQGLPIKKESIKAWAPFMAELRKQDVPIALHCDLGNATHPTLFLPLMDEVLRLYPNNSIIWMHMAGLSKQLDPQPPSLLEKPLLIPDHVSIITQRLQKHPNLFIDLSWDVLYDELWVSPKEKQFYVDMINEYPKRFISGSDHVAAIEKAAEVYFGEVNRTSDIYGDLSDDAFRQIALGENYFKLAGLKLKAPAICGSKGEAVPKKVKHEAPSKKQSEAKASPTTEKQAPSKPNVSDSKNEANVSLANDKQTESKKETDVSNATLLEVLGASLLSAIADEFQPIKGALKLSNFKEGSTSCYDRVARNNWAVVDAHLHIRPFGGPPVPFEENVRRLRKTGILFALGFGIGQRLPIDSPCSYYLDCPGTNLTPSRKNDFNNAQHILDYNESLATDPAGPVFTLALSSLDLHHPEDMLPKLRLMQKEYPNMFNWVGEINVVKQAIWNNSQGLPITKESIKEWAPFMAELRKQDIPISLHCDLGNDKEPTKFLPLMDEVLKLYPDNKIVWVHMAGLSKQLDPKLLALLQKPFYIPDHVKIIKKRLESYPKLSVDLSWDVLYNEFYTEPEEMKHYVDLINEYPSRFISGSDHVAAIDKTEADYTNEVNHTSTIYAELSDEAFRSVALGQNYFKLAKLDYVAPEICAKSQEAHIKAEPANDAAAKSTKEVKSSALPASSVLQSLFLGLLATCWA
eukprot:TRINITY_DN58409_c0_g1_i1.p1 TRINITY_DN58409_c0_g1~~TRINITY_DN58409_c0_g1_i1.p1  ORF type:complete len:937 (-),score=186.14 TRINITY_DN58409_c0_g1_i1:515-3280(-)